MHLRLISLKFRFTELYFASFELLARRVLPVPAALHGPAALLVDRTPPFLGPAAILAHRLLLVPVALLLRLFP